MGGLYREVLHLVDHLDAQEYILILVGAILVGLLSLRGFGSRSKY